MLGVCPHGELTGDTILDVRQPCGVLKTFQALCHSMTDSRPKDVRSLTEAAGLFRDRLEGIKSGSRSPDFDWYPYNTFGVFPVLSPILREDRRDLVTLAGAGPVLDIGCG